MRIGLIGNQHGMAHVLGQAGFDIVCHTAETRNRHGLDGSHVEVVDDHAAFFERLEHPRRFVLDLPVGSMIDATIDTAYVVMEPGDVVVDPSGSYWGDTLRRFRRMRHRSIYYVDVGLLGSLPDAVILAAGDPGGVDLAWPLLERLVPMERLVRAGGAGAAHFTVMVHDAVATSLTHALSEAHQLLEAYPHEPEVEAVLERFWPAFPPPSPRAAWLLDDAVRLEASIPHLALGVMLEVGHALDEQRSAEPAPRVGGFVHPDDIL